MNGVLDRFSDNDLAVILIESIHKELHIPRSELPKGSQEQTWFHIKKENGSYIIDSIDYEKTRLATDVSQDLQSKLQAKMKRSKYKK